MNFKHRESVKPKLLDVPVNQVELRNDRPRQFLYRDAINWMKLSLSTAGQLQPIGVRRHGNGWILIFGHLRLHAAKQLGWETIQAMEYPESENPELVDLALWASENLHRLEPVLDEMAVTVSRLVAAGMSQSVIALALGKPDDWVKGMLKIARDPVVRRMIEEGRVADAESGVAFIQLAPKYQKMLLDSTGPITRESCERVQTLVVRDQQKKKQPVLQKSLQTPPQSDFMLDLFSPAGTNSNVNHTRSTADFFKSATDSQVSQEEPT
jgi:ParB family chromosome partitioning protein